MDSPDEKEIELGRMAGELLVRITKYLGGVGRLSMNTDSGIGVYEFNWTVKIRDKRWHAKYFVELICYETSQLDRLAQDIAGQWKYDAERAAEL